MIAQVNNRTAAIRDAEADCETGMIQESVRDLCLSKIHVCLQFTKCEIGAHVGQGNGEVVAVHLSAENSFQGLFGSVQAVDRKVIERVKGGCEERKPLNVIPMGVAHEDVSFDGCALKLLQQCLAKDPDARPRIEDQQLSATAHFRARSVATILGGGWSGCCDRAARTPEANHERGWFYLFVKKLRDGLPELLQVIWLG